MTLLHPYTRTDRPAPGSSVPVDEGTLFDFQAETIHASIGFAVDMPLPRAYSGIGGQPATTAADSWPLEYDGAGYPLGRRVLAPHRDAAGDYGVYNGARFANLPWWTPQGTLLIGVTPLDQSSVFARVLELSNGSPAERIGILRHGDRCLLRVESGNRQVVRLESGPLVALQYNKIALGYAAGDWRLSVNGGSKLATGTGAVPAVDQAHVGGLRGIVSNMLMHNLRYWSDVKTNLKGLSAL